MNLNLKSAAMRLEMKDSSVRPPCYKTCYTRRKTHGRRGRALVEGEGEGEGKGKGKGRSWSGPRECGMWDKWVVEPSAWEPIAWASLFALCSSFFALPLAEVVGGRVLSWVEPTIYGL